jgi:hypothetical protein
MENTIILRNRLRKDGYDPKTDAVHDAMQAIRLVRAYASEFRIDPRRIGIMGFSAGAELSSPAALGYPEFDAAHRSADDPLAGVSSRPDFVGIDRVVDVHIGMVRRKLLDASPDVDLLITVRGVGYKISGGAMR